MAEMTTRDSGPDQVAEALLAELFGAPYPPSPPAPRPVTPESTVDETLDRLQPLRMQSVAPIHVEAPVDSPGGAPKHRSLARDVAFALLVAALVAGILRWFVVGAYEIPSESMTPTLEVGDRILVNKLSYRAHDPRRGDVIVFDRPPAAGPGPLELIKRVIGLPGDVVDLKDGVVTIDGRELREPYLLQDGTQSSMDGPVRVPRGTVFVMGDHRSDSTDSRVFGPVAEASIVGRAFVVVWPTRRVSYL